MAARSIDVANLRALALAAGLMLFTTALATRDAAADTLTGGDTTYVVRKGDNIELVGARTGVDWKVIAKANEIDLKKPLKPGQQLKVDTRRIVPQPADDSIVINIPDRTLYLFNNGNLVVAVPVGLGKSPKPGKRDWSTPAGKFSIVRKEKNPTWYVPKSIQEEMEEEGKPVKTFIPPGPDNPLGARALKTSLSGIMIHETIKPTSVFQFRSHGCIRMLPEHMDQLFDKVEINTPGRLIYKPVKAAVTDKGRILVEVRRDVYGKFRNLRRELDSMLRQLGVETRVDRSKVDRALKEKTGIPVDVTL